MARVAAAEAPFDDTLVEAESGPVDFQQRMPGATPSMRRMTLCLIWR
jgi:hypothetical protein